VLIIITTSQARSYTRRRSKGAEEKDAEEGKGEEEISG